MSDKDRIIQDLSYRAGHAESELKNSVSMIEYKKQSFLLESAKAKTEEDIKQVQSESLALKEEAIQTKFVLYILLSLVAILLILCTFLLYFFL
jgi:type III secretory pathway lipoprotein EscJ